MTATFINDMGLFTEAVTDQVASLVWFSVLVVFAAVVLGAFVASRGR